MGLPLCFGVRDRAMELAFIMTENLQHGDGAEVELEHVEDADYGGNEKDSGVDKNVESEKDNRKEDLDDEQLKQQHQQQQQQQPQPVLPNFVIGISGAPSSGKTTLSLLLDIVLKKALRQLDSPNVRPDPPVQNAVVHQDRYFVTQQQKPPASTTESSTAEDGSCIDNCDFELLAQHIDELDAGAHPATTTTTIAPDADASQHAFAAGSAPSAASSSALSRLSPGTLGTAVSALRNALADVLLLSAAAADSAKPKPKPDLAARSPPHACLDAPGAAPRVARRFAVVEGATILARAATAAAQDPVGWVAPGSAEHRLRSARRVQDRLDACLFLPLPLPSEGEAARRRVERSPWGEMAARRGLHFGGMVTWRDYERHHQHILASLGAAYGREESDRGRRLRRGRAWELRNEWEGDPRVGPGPGSGSSGTVHVRPLSCAVTVDDTLLWAARVVGAALGERLLHDSTRVPVPVPVPAPTCVAAASEEDRGKDEITLDTSSCCSTCPAEDKMSIERLCIGIREGF
ncbi:hypothetical protein Hte_004756 [Hypoxylon texense]